MSPKQVNINTGFDKKYMSPENLPPKLVELIEEFRMIEDQNERMDMLIYYSEDFQEVPEDIAVRPFSEDHKVVACESEAYVWSIPREDGTLKYYFAVENPQGISAKAMSAILDETASGAPLEAVAKLDPEVVYELFGRNMSMGKSAGLTSLVSTVRAHAIEQLAKQ